MGDVVIGSVNDAIELIHKNAEFTQLTKMPDLLPAEVPVHRAPFGIWFRGQSQHEGLQPSVFRSPCDETSMTYEFLLRAANSGERCKNTFDWLCLMRHYELPTRLLDWTENLLVALYFAVQSWDEVPGHLFILNASKLNRISRRLPNASKETLAYRASHGGIAIPWSVDTALRAEMSRVRSLENLLDQIASFDRNYIEDRVTVDHIAGQLHSEPGEMVEYLRKPLAVFPNRLDTRMILQQSVFTLHGGKEYRDSREPSPGVTLLPKEIGLIEVQTMHPEDRFFLHVTVKNKSEIRDRLLYMGIHEASLFPELDRLSSYVSTHWSGSGSSLPDIKE